ncbi:hypothetical protein C942_01364 [Photobacterium marinum]|uniref:Uncharacterized protein n=1 Tax=Photobacterium marinum TaxID=1056511 RepID=L8JF27_9GAMM|nr:hypothetical protein C942_01364 [Photobacterium marinum]
MAAFFMLVFCLLALASVLRRSYQEMTSSSPEQVASFG